MVENPEAVAEQTPIGEEVELKISKNERESLAKAYSRQKQGQELRKQVSLALVELIFDAIGIQGEFQEASQETQNVLSACMTRYVKNKNSVKRFYYDPATEKLMISYNTPDSTSEKKDGESESTSPSNESTNNGDNNTMSEQNTVANDADVERDPAVTDPTLPPSVGQGEDATAEDSGGNAETETSESSEEEATDDTTDDTTGEDV